MDKKLLIHYSLYKIKRKEKKVEDYISGINYAFYKKKMEEDFEDFLNGFEKFTDRVFFYITSPFRSEYDILVWSVVSFEKIENFFISFTKHKFEFNDIVELKEMFWGFTKPSIYTKGQSPQEINPFTDNRKNYFIVYPFVKTADWYLLSFEERKEMMYEHIRIGRKYQEILQLLIYSFGLNDSEFVVAYETDDLMKFEELVEELRTTKARIYTKRDTPIITGIYMKKEDILNVI